MREKGQEDLVGKPGWKQRGVVAERFFGGVGKGVVDCTVESISVTGGRCVHFSALKGTFSPSVCTSLVRRTSENNPAFSNAGYSRCAFAQSSDRFLRDAPMWRFRRFCHQL